MNVLWCDLRAEMKSIKHTHQRFSSLLCVSVVHYFVPSSLPTRLETMGEVAHIMNQQVLDDSDCPVSAIDAEYFANKSVRPLNSVLSLGVENHARFVPIFYDSLKY